MLHDVKDEVEANKHKGVLHPAVGFVWHVHGPVTDAKINMDSAGCQPERAALSVQRPRSAATWLNGLRHKSRDDKVLSLYAQWILCGANCYLYLNAVC
jgi:hypothetical protein